MTVCGPLDLPIPPEIHEEPIRPLLAVLDRTARATLLALQAENADGWPHANLSGEPPLDGAAWLEPALAAQIDGLLNTLEVYARALRDRHCLRHMRNHDF